MSENQNQNQNQNQGDIISRIKGDDGLAQRARCGGCSRPMAQNDGDISAANLVPIKDKKMSRGGGQATGLLCNTCLNDKARKDEGPRVAVYISPTTGQIGEIYYDNLVDAQAPKTATATEAAPAKKVNK